MCRNKKVESGLNKEDLLVLLGNVSENELNVSKYFIEATKSSVINEISLQYKEYEEKSLLKYFESINYVSFPIPLSYLNLKKKEIIITYFYLKGLKITLPRRILTDEQQIVVNSGGVIIVNAGPGTGKTTTACTKAYQLSRSYRKVLFISYTNAAVKEDKIRMLEYPYKNDCITFSTVDSLAGKICSSISESYDHNIREAISRVESRIRFQFKLNDVIIDESQDIDDLRFELLIKMYLYGYFESLTIFGDPRQRIRSKAGKWYYDMWKNIRNNSYQLYGCNINITKIGFTYSQRFNNLKILELVNSISQLRSEIHHQLVLSKNIPDNSSLDLPILIMNNGLDEIVAFIKDKISKGYKYSDFIFISPSIDSDNKTSKNCQSVSSHLRYSEIPCKMESQGSYHSNAILFTTIQSSKGKEAEFVFLIGMNNYNNNFSMIPKDEIESLVFVAHSRAKTKIIYVIERIEIVLPLGISKEFLDLSIANNNIIKTHVDEFKDCGFKFSISNLCNDHDLDKLLETNNFKLGKEPENYLFQKMPERTDCLDFYGIITGMAIGIFCTMELPNVINKYLSGNYIIISDKNYEQLKRYNLNFINGFNLETGILMIKKSEASEINQFKYLLTKPINELNINDFYKLTELFVKATWGYKIFYKEDLDEGIILYWKYNANQIISNFGNIIGVEVSVKMDFIVGSIDILTDNYIIELKTKNNDDISDSLQCWLYKSCMDSKRIPIVLNLNKKTCYKVTSNRNINSWKYILSKFCQIKISQYNINEKIKKIGRSNSFNQQNLFCVDTEFNTQIQGKASIFEISIFNCTDPYRSIISIINNGDFNKIPCMQWLKIDEELYLDSPSIDFINTLFLKVVTIYQDSPIIYYYLANNDISWLENNRFYTFTCVDLSKVLNIQGYFESHIKKPKLIDLYNSVVDFIETREELKHHTAISDTIMLYEILMLFK